MQSCIVRTYRERYYEFLKYRFPRIPLPQDIEHFRTLAALGQRLIDSSSLERYIASRGRSYKDTGFGGASV